MRRLPPRGNGDRGPARERRFRRRGLIILAGGTFVLVVLAAWQFLRPGMPTDFAPGTQVDLARYRGPNPTGVPASLAAADPVRRGEYLTRAADCAACHSAPGGLPFAGGLAFKLPFGTLYSTNITPDKETGIGEWSDEDFLRAMQDGVGRDGSELYPAFPYTSYTLLTRSDVLAIKAYLFSLPPVRAAPPADALSFPYDQRRLLFFWKLLFDPARRFRPNADQSPAWNRGAYLIEALGHCGECHTPRNMLQAVDGRRKFAGSTIEGWKAYNITSDPHAGIGGWSDAQLAAYFSTGHSEGRGSAGGPMALAVGDSLRFLTPNDIRAMVAYLRSIPPVAGTTSPAWPREVLGPKADGEDLGLQVFQRACASCHDWQGGGTVTSYAALRGARALDDPAAVNATNAVLRGTRLETSHGAVFMPPFARGYSDVEIAGLVNYVTHRFGKAKSSLTPGDIAERRRQE